MSTTSPVVQVTPIRITTVSPAEDAAHLIELCGGDNLEAWRIALGRVKSDPQLADHWLAVADSTVHHHTIPLPTGIAGLLLELITTAQNIQSSHPLVAEAHAHKAVRLASEPRIKHWARAAEAFLAARRA